MTELPDKEKCIEKIDDDFYNCYTDLIECQKKGLTRSKYINPEHVGLSTNKDEYTLPDTTRQCVTDYGYWVKD